MLNPAELLLAKGHRTTGRGHPPMDEGLVQTAVLLGEVSRPVIGIAFIAHQDSFSQNP